LELEFQTLAIAFHFGSPFWGPFNKKENVKLLAQAKLRRIGVLAPNCKTRIHQEMISNNEKI